jgi:hypothetical protein
MRLRQSAPCARKCSTTVGSRRNVTASSVLSSLGPARTPFCALRQSRKQFRKWSKPADLLVSQLRIVRITGDHSLNFRLFIVRQRALCREFLQRHRLRSFRLAGRMEITEMASAPNGLKTTVIVISAHSPIATKRPLSVGPNAASAKNPVSRSAKSRPCLARFVSLLASSHTILMNLCTRECGPPQYFRVRKQTVDA